MPLSSVYAVYAFENRRNGREDLARLMDIKAQEAWCWEQYEKTRQEKTK